MKIFHGWKMVGAAAGIQFLQAGILHQAFGAYFTMLEEEKGWSKTSLSGAAALQSTEAAVVGPFLGWLIDRFGAQNLIRIGVLVLGAGFITLSRIDTLAGFYGAVILIALGSSMCGFFPLNVSIIQWFERKRARALSMVGLGLALGGVAVPVVAGSMQAFGWRTTALASGLAMIVVGLPLASVFRRRPEDFGEHVDGDVPGRPASAKAGVAAVGRAFEQLEFTARQALRTRAFWLLSLGHGVALLVVTAVNVHAISHMRESLGYSVAQASFFITMMTLSQVVGVLLGSVIGDRFDKRRVAACCMLSHAAGLLLLTFASGAAMLVGFAVLHGTAWGLRGPFMQAIRADFFGRRSIGMILGLSAIVTALGQIFGPMIAGATADLTGDYRTGFSLIAAVAAGGSLLFLLARRPLLPVSPTAA
ncbi:MAG: MFS transporter [Lautropia sp.]